MGRGRRVEVIIIGDKQCSGRAFCRLHAAYLRGNRLIGGDQGTREWQITPVLLGKSNTASEENDFGRGSTQGQLRCFLVS